MSCRRTGGTHLANNLVEVVTDVVVLSGTLEVRDDAGCLLRLFCGCTRDDRYLDLLQPTANIAPEHAGFGLIGFLDSYVFLLLGQLRVFQWTTAE